MIAASTLRDSSAAGAGSTYFLSMGDEFVTFVSLLEVSNVPVHSSQARSFLITIQSVASAAAFSGGACARAATLRLHPATKSTNPATIAATV
jgi:hypothetical protein